MKERIKLFFGGSHYILRVIEEFILERIFRGQLFLPSEQGKAGLNYYIMSQGFCLIKTFSMPAQPVQPVQFGGLLVIGTSFMLSRKPNIVCSTSSIQHESAT